MDEKLKQTFIDTVTDSLGINCSDNLEYDLDQIWPMVYCFMRDHFVDQNEMLYRDAKKELDSIAMYLWSNFYSEESPNFELIDSLIGVISQIDNMISGLV